MTGLCWTDWGCRCCSLVVATPRWPGISRQICVACYVSFLLLLADLVAIEAKGKNSTAVYYTACLFLDVQHIVQKLYEWCILSRIILFIYVLYFLICYARWIASYWFILCHCGCWPEDVAPRPDDWSARWNRHSLSLPPFVGWDVASLWPEVRGSWVVRGVLPFLCLGMFPPCFLFFPGIS